MTVVHYYLGRPARVWIAASSCGGLARQAHEGSGRVRNGGPGKPATGLLGRRRIEIARFGAAARRLIAAHDTGPARLSQVVRYLGIPASPA